MQIYSTLDDDLAEVKTYVSDVDVPTRSGSVEWTVQRYYGFSFELRKLMGVFRARLHTGLSGALAGRVSDLLPSSLVEYFSSAPTRAGPGLSFTRSAHLLTYFLFLFSSSGLSTIGDTSQLGIFSPVCFHPFINPAGLA